MNDAAGYGLFCDGDVVALQEVDVEFHILDVVAEV
jgi:hypothetical protein